MARVRSLLRRRAKPLHQNLAAGDVEMDRAARVVTVGGQEVGLSPKEFAVLEYLLSRAGEVVTREELLDAVWGYDTIPFTRTVDTHIAKLRKKIETDPANPEHLITVHRLGYKLVDQE